MDTGTIVAIVVIAVIAIALVAFLSTRTKGRKIAREVENRREQKVEAHRSEAETRAREAERLEAEARARRAEADAHAQHAEVHEKGLADDDLHREVRADLDGDGVADDSDPSRRFTREPADTREREPDRRL